MAILALIALAVLSLSALASGTEAALFSVPYARARTMAKAGRRGAKALVRVKEDMARAIGTIVIVNNIANIVGSAVVGAVAGGLFGSAALGAFFAAFTLAIIVFSELIPKTVGEAHADRLAPLMAPAVLALTGLFRPVLWLIERMVRPFHAGAALKAKVSEEEIKMMALLGREAGAIEADESRMIRHVFKLNDITADDMMTPADRVESIPGDVPLGDQKIRVLDLRHSRVPVTGDAPNQVLGVALTRDLIAAAARDEFQATPSDFLQEALRVRNDVAADDLLPLFQRSQQHLAIVEDADGRMVGVVTLEDVLEELVGEIADEKDVRPETIKRVSKTEILVDEGTDVGRINHFFNVAIPFEGEIGDYVMEKFGRRPRVGEALDDGPLTFVVSSMSRTRPRHVAIRKAS
jgi:CBS domain containing-hemolysin-like protein